MNNGTIYLSAALQLGKVEGLAGGDLDVVQHNGRAGRLASLGGGGRGEGTAGGAALNEIGNRDGSRGTGHGGGAEGQHGNERSTHFGVNVRSTDN